MQIQPHLTQRPSALMPLVYAIGSYDSRENVGFHDGPHPSLVEMLGRTWSDGGYIFRLDGQSQVAIFSWSKEEGGWTATKNALTPMEQEKIKEWERQRRAGEDPATDDPDEVVLLDAEAIAKRWQKLTGSANPQVKLLAEQSLNVLAHLSEAIRRKDAQLRALLGPGSDLRDPSDPIPF